MNGAPRDPSTASRSGPEPRRGAVGGGSSGFTARARILLATALLLAAGACTGPRPGEPSLRIHEPEPSGSEMVPPQRLSGEMPDLRLSMLAGDRTVACSVAATVTSDGELIELEWEGAADVLPGFRDEVVRAMRTWKFRPATFLGQPVAAPTRFEFDKCPVRGRAPDS